MAEENKDVYPILPVRHWWSLRSLFKASIPGVITSSYLASSLDMKEVSARTNVAPYLRQVGIIDEEGKPKNRAKEWRDDQQYVEVCKQIVKETYPSELNDACPDPVSDRACVERWFANRTGSGEIAVRKMAAFYITLREADASKAPILKGRKTPAKSKPSKAASKAANKMTTPPTSPAGNGKDGRSEPSTPSIHINLEVHISADASPDQIDKIFESMAKHIYQKKS